MDIIFFIRILWTRKWIILGVSILSSVAAYFLSSGVRPEYKSSARLSTSITVDDQVKMDEERINLREAGVKFNNLIQTMNSELVISMVSYRLLLHDLVDQERFRENEDGKLSELSNDKRTELIKAFNSRYDSIKLLSAYNPEDQELNKMLINHGYANWQLKDKLDIKWLRDTDYIIVQFLSENPFLSAFVVNAISEEYIRYDNSLKDSHSNKSVTFFEELVSEKKKTLDQKLALLGSYKSSSGLIDHQSVASTQIAQISEYELRREQHQSDVQRLRISINSIDKKLRDLENMQGGESTLASINSNIVRIREKINQLNQEYIQSGSTNKELEKTIADLRYQLQVEMDKVSRYSATSLNLKQELLDHREQYVLELEIANANLASISASIGNLKGELSSQATTASTIDDLQREVDEASKEYNQALDRFNLERNRSLLANSPVKILVRGQPNINPEISKRVLIVIFSLFLSFFSCVFLIVFIEYLDVRVKNPYQFEKFVKLNLIGSINQVDTKNLNLHALFTSTNGKHTHEMEVLKHFLRKLRFEIESSRSKVILVTSAKPSEGKSFIIFCLAYLLSLLHKQILIIDTNFKHNSLTQLMIKKANDVKKLEQGIFIRGLIGDGDEHDMTGEDFASTIIQSTGYKGISIIGNNGGNESPSEIFAGRDFGEMITGLSNNFDYILMEGAALNNYSDTKELVDFVDKVITVFSASSMIKQIDRESIGYLRSLNSKFLGAVLNNVETKELTIY